MSAVPHGPKATVRSSTEPTRSWAAGAVLALLPRGSGSGRSRPGPSGESDLRAAAVMLDHVMVTALQRAGHAAEAFSAAGYGLAASANPPVLALAHLMNSFG